MAWNFAFTTAVACFNCVLDWWQMASLLFIIVSFLLGISLPGTGWWRYSWGICLFWLNLLSQVDISRCSLPVTCTFWPSKSVHHTILVVTFPSNYYTAITEPLLKLTCQFELFFCSAVCIAFAKLGDPCHKRQDSYLIMTGLIMGCMEFSICHPQS